jgi:hypothetical protein
MLFVIAPLGTLRLTLPLLPPPLNPAPAVTPVMVPVPGKVCPDAKLIWPLLAMFNPVSASFPDP